MTFAEKSERAPMGLAGFQFPHARPRHPPTGHARADLHGMVMLPGARGDAGGRGPGRGTVRLGQALAGRPTQGRNAL